MRSTMTTVIVSLALALFVAGAPIPNTLARSLLDNIATDAEAAGSTIFGELNSVTGGGASAIGGDIVDTVEGLLAGRSFLDDVATDAEAAGSTIFDDLNSVTGGGASAIGGDIVDTVEGLLADARV